VTGEPTVRLRLDYDFNDPPEDDGLYRALPPPYLQTRIGDLVVLGYGGDECEADGRIVGASSDGWLLIERTSDIRCGEASR